MLSTGPMRAFQKLVTMIRATVLAALLEMTVSAAILIPFGIMPPGFPRSVPFLDALLSMMFVDSSSGSRSRSSYRLYSGPGNTGELKAGPDRWCGGCGPHGRPGTSAEPASRAYSVGYVDDDPRKIGKWINGIKVLGALCRGYRRSSRRSRSRKSSLPFPTASGKTLREVRGGMQSAVACRAK